MLLPDDSINPDSPLLIDPMNDIEKERVKPCVEILDAQIALLQKLSTAIAEELWNRTTTSRFALGSQELSRPSSR